MRPLRAWVQRVAGILGSSRRERELAEELESHLQLHIDDNIRAGMTPAESRRQALIKFGPVEALKEEYRDRARIPVIDSMLQDMRYGVRSLRRHAGFALLAISTLALGVGSTTAMFGLVDALMVRPLPHVSRPDRLAVIEEIANYARNEDVGSRVRTMDFAGYLHVMSVSLGAGPQARSIDAQCVTESYFSVVGTSPVIGRGFARDEHKPGGAPVIVIAHGLWMRQFGADANVLGRRVRIADQDYSIIGVAPRGFRGIGSSRVDAWLPLGSHADLCLGNAKLMEMKDGGFWLTTIARVRDGFSIEQATADVIAADSTPPMIQLRQPDGSIETRRLTKPPHLTPVREAVRGEHGSDNQLALWLAGGAIVLLLISSANVAGLLAARAVERRREIAVRMQLGASRGRVFQQLLSENLALAGFCAIAAIAVAWVLELVLVAFYPLADGNELLAGRTPLLLLLAALVAGLMSGAIPAFQASRADVAHHLRTGRSVNERARFRTMLLMAQVALALILIVGAGLFVRSVANFHRELGYDDVHRVVTASVDFSRAGFRDVSDARSRYELMLDRVRQLPDVESAALSNTSVAGTRGGSVTSIGRNVFDADSCCHAAVRVSPEYFSTLGMRIVRGRAFTDADTRPKAPRVVILEEDLARQIFGVEDPIGQCVAAFFDTACVQVVGVSNSARRGLLRTGQLDSQFFLPLTPATERSDAPQMLLVRKRTSSKTTTAAIAAAIRSAAPDLPYVDIQPLGDLVNLEARRWRMGASLFGLFGTLAVALAAVGIYGALAFSIRQRTPEFGVRIAFGADPFDIVTMVVRQALPVVLVGWVLGALATFSLTSSIRSLLFNVAPGDVAPFVSASMIVLIAALAGSLIPAIRAARIEPAVALRAE